MPATACRESFPVNTKISLKRADWIVRFIQKNGLRAAIEYSCAIGLTQQEIADFYARNLADARPEAA